MCSELRALPRPGGVLDQDARLMYLLEVVFRAQAERRANDIKKQQNEAESKARMRR